MLSIYQPKTLAFLAFLKRYLCFQNQIKVLSRDPEGQTKSCKFVKETGTLAKEIDVVVIHNAHSILYLNVYNYIYPRIHPPIVIRSCDVCAEFACVHVCVCVVFLPLSVGVCQVAVTELRANEREMGLHPAHTLIQSQQQTNTQKPCPGGTLSNAHKPNDEPHNAEMQ